MKVILAVDPVKFPLTGIGRYTYELARQLQRHSEIERLYLFAGRRFLEHLPKPGGNPSAGHHLRRWLIKSRVAVGMYQFVFPIIKARALKGREDCVFHSPNFYLPSFAGRSVVTIHDLSMYLWTQCHPPERVRYMQKELPLSLKRADLLLTDSEYIRREVISFFGWPPEKIRAIPLAGSGAFRPRRPEETRPALDRLGLKAGGYALFAGTIEPRKNIDTLFDAYSRLPEKVRRRWPLVLTGYEGWSNEKLHQRINTAVRQGWARHLGYTAGDDLPMLYAGARLFVFPSLYEGFGLPVLEAMASGVPVVCSNSSSLPEVAGDAAAMCDALDVDTLRYLIEQGLQDEAWRAAAIERGLQRAAQFSWRRCAGETVAVYREALDLAVATGVAG